MTEKNKRKGKRTVSDRLFFEEENQSSNNDKILEELFDIFMKAKELEGLRERTLKDHRAHFKYFLIFLKNNYPRIKYGDEISTDIIRDYVYFMSKEKRLWDDHTQSSMRDHTDKKGLSPVTINIRLRTLKCFFKFLYDEEHINHNPTSKVKLQKRSKTLLLLFLNNKLSIYLINQIKEATLGLEIMY